MAHALIGAIARHFPGADPCELKHELIARFPQFLAQAEGRRVLPRRAIRESTAEMESARFSNLIEFLLWIGTEMGVQFRNDD